VTITWRSAFSASPLRCWPETPLQRHRLHHLDEARRVRLLCLRQDAYLGQHLLRCPTGSDWGRRRLLHRPLAAVGRPLAQQMARLLRSPKTERRHALPLPEHATR
jgi:hypothetical protein